MKVTRASFSVLLPLIELATWIVLIAVPATLVFLNLNQTAHGSLTAHIDSGNISADIPRQQFLSFAFSSAPNNRAHAITAINIPGIIPEILFSLLTSWPQSWLPPGWILDTWRALIFPFYCLPAWWFVGLGVDSLLGWRRLHWGTLLLGSIFFLLFVTLSLGFRFGLSASERAEGDSGWLLWGIGLWALFFATFPCAWLRQTRFRVAE
jgi:hypothetical protein